MPETFASSFGKLDALLNRGMYDGVAFRLECCNGFEPHGRASETWETFWLLTIPDIPRHWKSTTDGWTLCNQGSGAQSFKHKLPGECVRQAIAFLEESGVKQTLK